MTIRTSSKTVTFGKPFVIGGLNEVLPSGDYRVDTDEELLEDLSRVAYRRVQTLIHLHQKAGHSGRMLTLAIDPNELDAALMRDHGPAEVPASQGTSQRTPNETPEPCRAVTDRRAIERGESEGMTVRPE